MEEFILKGPEDNSDIPRKNFRDVFLYFFEQLDPKNVAFVSSLVFSIVFYYKLFSFINRLINVVEYL